MIDVRALSIKYQDVTVLRDVSLHVPAGQFLLISGPSGCGKSTLARALAGLIPHAIPAHMSGEVFVDDLNTRSHPLPELAHHVGIVLQNPSSQLFHLTVAEEVAFGPRNLGLPPEQVRQRVDWALETTGLQAFRRRRPTALSGGEQQRLAIAAVLAMQPAVIILDEPTASLDMQGARSVLSTLRRLNQQQDITIVLVEHRLDLAAPFAHRLLIMDQGHIVRDGAPDTLLQDRALRRKYGLRRPGAPLASVSPSWRHDLQHNESDVPASGQNGQRQVSKTAQLPQAARSQRPLLSLQNVSAGYGREPVIEHINLNIYSGDFAAIVGQNGAGKSTLARVLAGLLRPATGHVRFHASPTSERRPRPGRDVSLLFQNPLDQLFTDTVDDEISFGPRNIDRFDPAFHEELLLQADLRHLHHRCPTLLSAGQQQRCVLAACLALQPPLLILDEPTLGQDWGHLQQLMDFVQQLNEQGATILLISHDYKLVYRYARRVLLMEQGRLTLDGALPQPAPAVDKKEHHETLYT